jgi:hypothetical protein
MIHTPFYLLNVLGITTLEYQIIPAAGVVNYLTHETQKALKRRKTTGNRAASSNLDGQRRHFSPA